VYEKLKNPRLIGYRQVVAFEPTEHGPVDGLGQLIPESVVEQIADKLVAKADPRVRQILAEEKVKLAEGLKKSLPFAGISVTSFLLTLFLVPDEKKILKLLGFGVASGSFLTGLYFFADKMAELSRASVERR